jgi:hypothetical protein
MSALVTVRFPSGETEFRMSEKSLKVGETLKRNGDNWIVEEVTDGDDGSTVVTLRPEPKPVTPDEAEGDGRGA